MLNKTRKTFISSPFSPNQFTFVEMAQETKYPMTFCPDLTHKLMEIAQKFKNLDNETENLTIKLGKTLSTNDFYLGQGRLDGAFTNSTKIDQTLFFEKLQQEHNIINFEMEGHCFSAFCNRAKIRAAMVCVALVNRLKGDQINCSKSDVEKWILNGKMVLVEYFKSRL